MRGNLNELKVTLGINWTKFGNWSFATIFFWESKFNKC